DADFLLQEAPLHLKGTLSPFAAEPQSQGHVELYSLPLAWLAPALAGAGISALGGSVSANLDYDARVQPAVQAVKLDTTGRVTVSSGTARGGVLPVTRAGFSGQVGWEAVHIEADGKGLKSVSFDHASVGPGARVEVLDSSFRPVFRYAL